MERWAHAAEAAAARCRALLYLDRPIVAYLGGPITAQVPHADHGAWLELFARELAGDPRHPPVAGGPFAAPPRGMAPAAALSPPPRCGGPLFLLSDATDADWRRLTPTDARTDATDARGHAHTLTR